MISGQRESVPNALVRRRRHRKRENKETEAGREREKRKFYEAPKLLYSAFSFGSTTRVHVSSLLLLSGPLARSSWRYGTPNFFHNLFMGDPYGLCQWHSVQRARRIAKQLEQLSQLLKIWITIFWIRSFEFWGFCVFMHAEKTIDCNSLFYGVVGSNVSVKSSFRGQWCRNFFTILKVRLQSIFSLYLDNFKSDKKSFGNILVDNWISYKNVYIYLPIRLTVVEINKKKLFTIKK